LGVSVSESVGQREPGSNEGDREGEEYGVGDGKRDAGDPSSIGFEESRGDEGDRQAAEA